MSATPEQIAEPHSFSPDEIAQRIEHFGATFDLDVMKKAAALIRAQAERVRVLESALTTIGHSLVCAPVDYAEHNASELLRAGNIARAALQGEA